MLFDSLITRYSSLVTIKKFAEENKIINFAIRFYQYINQIQHEKNISAFEQEKTQQTRFQGKNVYRQWSQGFVKPQSKRKKEVDGFR